MGTNTNKLRIKPMTLSEYPRFHEKSKADFVESKVEGEQMDRSEAEKVATASYESLLPVGVDTPDHFLYTLETDQQEWVGWLWLHRKRIGNEEQVYVYSIYIEKEFRGQGLGKSAMRWTETQCRKWGVKSIGLHVFGFNNEAYNLYKSLGYRTTNRNMRKDLDSDT